MVAAVLTLLIVPGRVTRDAVPAPAPVIAGSAQNNASAGQTPSTPSVPATRTYVVKPGDSLWKIFSTLRPQSPDRRGWMDFVSKAQSLNSLGDPDQLQPGKILTLSAPQ
jgi:nucleoid-associated protein YgaU